MKAIRTKVLPVTLTKPTRIKAEMEGIKPFVTSIIDHDYAAQALLDRQFNGPEAKQDQHSSCYYFVKASGALPDGSHCHVLERSSLMGVVLRCMPDGITLRHFAHRWYRHEGIKARVPMPDFWQVPCSDLLLALLTKRCDHRTLKMAARAIRHGLHLADHSIFERVVWHEDGRYWTINAAQDYNATVREIRKELVKIGGEV